MTPCGADVPGGTPALSGCGELVDDFDAHVAGGTGDDADTGFLIAGTARNMGIEVVD